MLLEKHPSLAFLQENINGTCFFNKYRHLNKLIEWDGRIGFNIFAFENFDLKFIFDNHIRVKFPILYSPKACRSPDNGKYFIVFGIKTRIENIFSCRFLENVSKISMQLLKKILFESQCQKRWLKET